MPSSRPQAYRETPPNLQGRVLTVSKLRLVREEEKRREGRAGDPPAIRSGMMFEIEVAEEPLLSLSLVVDVPDPKPASAPEEGAEIIEEDVWGDPDDEPGDVWLIPRVENGAPVPDDWNRALCILRSARPVLESLQEWDQHLSP